ncbi:hypothetical protein C8A01DRAFT_34013 [Parachaetomium inaequale]|uniref:Uncharacterized protein n=1 Tax=Parachaetomium inaequale TaxID=2588326 RepID=A0AAN6PJP2_9PEZI|nr:hypothetical protein C8A01DRAFT_34013 [Parachaetomium inaequale]
MRWLNYLVCFIQRFFDHWDDATADDISDFESETRASIRQEILSLGTERCLLDHLAFKVYRAVMIQTTDGDEHRFVHEAEMPLRASGPPFVDFSVLLPALTGGGDERVVFIRYVRNCAKEYCSVDGWPATVSDSLDSKYPFFQLAVTDQGVTCPAWSVPLHPRIDVGEHIYGGDLQLVMKELSGLELQYDPTAHTVRAALPSADGDVMGGVEILSDNPMIVCRMQTAPNLLSFWVSEMAAKERIIPLSTFVSDHRAGLIERPAWTGMALRLYRQWVGEKTLMAKLGRARLPDA